MGLFDKLTESMKATLDAAVAADAPAAITGALTKTGLGSLNEIVNQLQQGGLEKQVESWLGSGPNMAVTAEQIRVALGNNQVAEFARQFGLPVDAALQMLARHLPAIIDQASPNGTIRTT